MTDTHDRAQKSLVEKRARLGRVRAYRRQRRLYRAILATRTVMLAAAAAVLLTRTPLARTTLLASAVASLWLTWRAAIASGGRSGR